MLLGQKADEAAAAQKKADDEAKAKADSEAKAKAEADKPKDDPKTRRRPQGLISTSDPLPWAALIRPFP